MSVYVPGTRARAREAKMPKDRYDGCHRQQLWRSHTRQQLRTASDNGVAGCFFICTHATGMALHHLCP
jgi:hypothetical protein